MSKDNWTKIGTAKTTTSRNRDTITMHAPTPVREHIAVIAGQFDEGAGNKMMFAAQAVRYLRKQQDKVLNSRAVTQPIFTLIMVKDSYNTAHISAVQKSVDRFAFNFHQISSVDELISYLNTRQESKVQWLGIFSHGVTFKVELGYQLPRKEQLSLNLSNYKNISPAVFATTARIELCSCRAGMGNPSDLQVRDITAPIAEAGETIGKLPIGGVQILSSLTSKGAELVEQRYGDTMIEDSVQFDPQPENSLAQKMANHYQIPVRAFITRSDYDGTWGTWSDRRKYKALTWTSSKLDQQWYNRFKAAADRRDKYIEKKQFAYDEFGAFDDVSAGILSTPVIPPKAIYIPTPFPLNIALSILLRAEEKVFYPQ